MAHIWFWQRMVTPHMTGLANSLAANGHRVEYIAEEIIPSERSKMGWVQPRLEGVQLHIINSPDDAVQRVNAATPGTVHLTQGFRSNGLVTYAQRQIRRRKADRHYIVMETVKCAGTKGFLKRGVYGWHLLRWADQIEGVLAIGYRTKGWLQTLSLKELNIYPFAYFLPAPDLDTAVWEKPNGRPFHFLFVGQLIDIKNVHALLLALSLLKNESFVLTIIGNGPEEQRLRETADKLLPGKVEFLGTRPINDIPAYMAKADCLVLPSKSDGWGAVVSEAMLVGTPVVCSTECGAAGVVQASGFGGTFAPNNLDEMVAVLGRQLELGTVSTSARKQLEKWATCLTSSAGAAYLDRILKANELGGSPPPPFWKMARNQSIPLSERATSS